MPDVRIRPLVILLGVILLTLLFTVVDVPTAYAACPSFPYTVPAGDVANLINAITCANGTSGNEVINLSNSTYTLTSAYSTSDGLPPISAGGGTLTINGNGAIITRSAAGGTPDFRFFYLNSGANLTLNNVTLTNGRVAGGKAGAIYNGGGTLTLNASTLSGNFAGGGGAIYTDTSGTLTVTSSTINGNTATNYGGAIEAVSGTIRVINSTISGNTVTGSGGVTGGGAFDFYSSPTVTITNSTIVNNSAGEAARSGIWLENGTLTIANTIVAENNGVNNCVITGTRIDNGGNLDNGTSCGFSGAVGQNTNPQLGVLANNGGQTLTHAFLANSPAINRGVNAQALDQNGAALVNDQRGAGFPRISGGAVDIGAVEVVCPTFPYTVPGWDASSLVLAIACANGTAANDVINLTNSTYILTLQSAFEIGLPPIVTAATGGTLTINGNGATIQRSSAGGTPNFKFFEVNTGANLTLDRITLTNGYAQVGGAIFSDGTLRITNSTISDNYALAGGAISQTGSASTTLFNSLIANNDAERYGGVLDMSAGAMFIINSTLSGNQTLGSDPGYGGGAIDAYNSPALTIINSTITNNTSLQAARSGIWLEDGTLTIANSIVANNNGANNCVITGTRIDNSGNLDNGTTCGFGGAVGQNTEPLLGALENNGGPTLTHALLSNSPAANRGVNAQAVDQNGGALANDQRGTGFPRISGGTVDVGAVEMQCPTFPYTVPAGDASALIFAITCANSTAGNEVINLTAASTYTLTSLFSDETGLPPISGGSGTLTINGNGATITRGAGAPTFRFFRLNSGANLTLNRVTLTNGHSSDRGGALYNYGGTLTLSASTISGNSADSGGGALYNDFAGTVTVTSSTINANTATGYGGAIEVTTGTIRIINSTISGNTVTSSGGVTGGGALSLYNAPTVTITNSTIANNTAGSAERSGIWLEDGTLTIANSIVANNNGANNCVITGTRIDNGGNLDNGTTCGFGGVVGQNTDPLLGALANNGGFTLTHALLSNSPAANRGVNAQAVDQNGAALANDQRGAGFPRIVGGTVDVGAYESSFTPPTVTISALDNAGAETGADPLTFRITRSPASSSALTVNYTVGGTASNGVDYLPTLSGAAIIPANAASVDITIAPADDSIDEANESVSLTLVADAVYVLGANTSASGTISDNDDAGITVNPTSGLVTTEAGGQATFTVVLNTQPIANVVIGISSSDTTEGTVLPTSITFTSANWNVAQVVTVTGVNDSVDDGNIGYSIVTAAVVSGDPNYSGLNPTDVGVTNSDNDDAGIAVNPTSGLVTTEAGGQATFTVVLNTQPIANVMIGISSSDTTEGTVLPTSLTFTSANWNVAQVVTVTGVDDLVEDGNIGYSIVTAAVVGGDPNYSGLNPTDVSVTNNDNDNAPQLPPAATLIAPTGQIAQATPLFQWNKVSTATEYQFYLSQLDGVYVVDVPFTAAEVCGASVCQVTLPDALQGGAYRWWIRTRNEVGDGPWSTSLDFSVMLPPVTATLIAPVGAQTSVPTQFQWNAVRGAYWYYIWLANSSGHVLDRWYNAYDICVNSVCTVPVPGDVTIGFGPHQWWVQAWNPYGGYGAWSSSLIFSLTTRTPVQESLVGATTDTSPEYVWLDVPEASWYYLWVSGPNGYSLDQWYSRAICGGDGRCRVTPGVVAAGNYRWWIQAWSEHGSYSVWSGEMAFSITAPVVPDVELEPTPEPPPDTGFEPLPELPPEAGTADQPG